jgi:hypothetical protein
VEDGRRQSKHEVLAERVQFLPGPTAIRVDGQDATASSAMPGDDEEIPF